ncbi:MAG: hypothetical protein IT168_09665 [Bryobacterales bacterium]|nr:hypothetical protein [Bryobacterales bacterium]
MTPPVECPFEAEVLAAVLQGWWPQRAAAGLRTHVAGCPVCAGVVAVGTALLEDRRHLRSAAVLPNAGRVWWLAQTRARRDAAAAANRAIDLGIGAALLGAAAVAWAFLPVQEWIVGLAGRIGPGGLPIVAAALLVLIFLPAAACLAFSRD